MTILTFYCPEMNGDEQSSPSATKPRLVRRALTEANIPVTVFKPEPVTPETLSLAHDPEFVKDVLSLETENGFGTRSEEIARSLPYTTGAMLSAATAAVKGQLHSFELPLSQAERAKLDRRASRAGVDPSVLIRRALFGSDRGRPEAAGPVAALSSGFHHAGYDSCGGFCTFNGLMVTAMALLRRHESVSRVAIIDADQHYGDGTDDIIERLHEEGARFHGPKGPAVVEDAIFHYTFGGEFHTPHQAKEYLARMRSLEGDLATFKPDVLLYQAGADAHRDDPLGGVLSTEELFERDKILFGITRRLEIPVAWNLAGGYQREPDGSIPKVLEVHVNTFRAALAEYEGA